MDAVIWLIIIGVGGFYLIRFLVRQQEAENARRAQEAAVQRSYQNQLLTACNESMLAFESIPKDLMDAEQLLDVAESEFRDGAFSPFWDSVERAMRKLGAIDTNVKLISDRSSHYKAIVNSFKGTPPTFPVDPAAAHRLGTAGNTVTRLQQVVRGAQRNFQFATIYEQRKTNDILIAGFTNLGEAIHGVGARLEESIGILGDHINDLSTSMTEMNEKVVDAVKGVSSAVGEVSSRIGTVSSSITNSDKSMQAAMANQAARQETAIRMLDNIQRRRVPPPLSEY